MRRMKLGAAILATGLAFVGACGDDDSTPDAAPGNPDAAATADAATPDASPPPPDAPPAATRSGTISIQDVKLTDPAAAAVGGLGGLQATVFFSDLTAFPPVAPTVGTGGIGSCNVYQWTVDATGKSNEPPDTDEGAVTVGGAGLLATVPNPCTAVNGKYICVVGQIAAQAASTGPAAGMLPAGHSILKFDGIDFTAAPYNLKEVQLGAVPQHYFTLSGFAPGIDGLNLSTNGLVPGTTDTLLVFTGITPLPAATWTTAAAIVTTGSAYPAHAGRDSINGGMNNDQVVTVSRLAGVDLPAMADVSLKPAGEGFKLDTAKGQPNAFPTTAVDFEVNCETGDGVCGPNPELLTVFLMSGRATNGDVSMDATGLYMPPPLASSTYATFNCSFIGAKSGTVPAAAVQAILDTNPTRMQTRVFYTSGSIVQQGQDVTNVLVGHGLIGHTTFPAP